MSRSPKEGTDGLPRPDPEILRKDPMAEMFGPGSAVKMVGDPDDQMPDEIRAVLEEYGLSKKSFTCTLKEIPAGTNFNTDSSGSQSTKYIRSWLRSVPSMDYIAREYGPGDYVLAFSWRMRSEETDGESRAMNHEVPLTISEKFMEEYKRHRLDAKIKEASNTGTKVRDALIEKKIESQMVRALTGDGDVPQVSPAQAAKEYITQTLETVKMMGLPIGIQPQKGIEWDKILPTVVAGLTAFLQHQQTVERARQEDFNKLLMVMMGSSQNANSQLVEIMKLNTGVGTGANQFKEIRDMIFGAIDIKNALQGGEKETLADKIFRVVENVAPQILSIAATAATVQAAKANPVAKMAAGYIASNPDFQALRGNPVEMKVFIEKMDGFFGWKQADTILAVAGWERPADCARDPAKENPPQIQQEEPADVMTGNT